MSGIVTQNVVATVDLECKLDLKRIALGAWNVEYDPKRFPALVMRLKDPRTTASIFASGKIVCQGAKSESQAKMAARKYARKVQKVGFPVKFTNFKIQNIVASCDVKFPINLVQLNRAHAKSTSYEPEPFPGLTYRVEEPKVSVQIFASGKIGIKGAKRREDAYSVFERVYPIICEFRKPVAALCSPQVETDSDICSTVSG